MEEESYEPVSCDWCKKPILRERNEAEIIEAELDYTCTAIDEGKEWRVHTGCFEDVMQSIYDRPHLDYLDPI